MEKKNTEEQMKKFEVPMFYTLIFYVEGSPDQIKNQVTQIMKNYGLMFKNGRKSYDVEIDEHKHGGATYLVRDPESEGKQVGFDYYKAFVLSYNTENSSKKQKGIDQKKDKISTICHEVRHAVDKLMDCHHVMDRETPAYLTGWICGELLVNVI